MITKTTSLGSSIVVISLLLKMPSDRGRSLEPDARFQHSSPKNERARMPETMWAHFTFEAAVGCAFSNLTPSATERLLATCLKLERRYFC